MRRKPCHKDMNRFNRSGCKMRLIPSLMAALAALTALPARAQELVGTPIQGGTGFQPAATELARDLRLLVRERLVAGDTDEEAVAYIVDRYGEYVLLTPTATGANLILWLAGPLMLGAGLVIAGLYLRRRASAPEAEAVRLSAEEEARLRDILRD